MFYKALQYLFLSFLGEEKEKKYVELHIIYDTLLK